jgi:hypothetical protein
MKSLGRASFASNKLTSVAIPSGVTSMGGAVFRDNKLTSFAFPAGVTDMDWETVTSNPIKTLTVDASSSRYSSVDNVLFNKNKTNLLYRPEGLTGTSYTIPSGVTSIGELALQNNKFLSIVIPNSVTTMGCSVFTGSTKLASVYFAGNAPAISSGCLPFAGTAKGAKVYRHSEATGFSVLGTAWYGLTVARW